MHAGSYRAHNPLLCVHSKCGLYCQTGRYVEVEWGVSAMQVWNPSMACDMDSTCWEAFLTTSQLVTKRLWIQCSGQEIVCSPCDLRRRFDTCSSAYLPLFC